MQQVPALDVDALTPQFGEARDAPHVARHAPVVPQQVRRALFLAIGTLRRPWGLTVGWILQAVVLATSVIVGWSMLVVGGVFVVLWWLAIHNGSRVDAMRAQGSSGG